MQPAKSLLSRLAGTVVAVALMPGCTLPAEDGTGPSFEEEIDSTQEAAAMTMLGADMSSVQRTLDLGKRFYDAAGVQRDPLDIIKGIGANYVRLRVWVNPASGYNNKSKVITYAKAAKAKGMKVLIDFHYSDTWADPSKQFKPGAWNGHSISQLQSDVYNHTYDVCNSLKSQGATPDSVQIGNEINVGMLFNEGKVNNNDFTNLSNLLKSGYNAVKACNGGTQVMIHTANANSMANARWFYDGIRNKGVSWDITGLSYYCFWHGSMSNMQSVVADMRSRYGKNVVIVETAHPFTLSNADGQTNVVGNACSGYAATWEGQAAAFRDVQNHARNGGAIGVFYWEPAWYAVAGNGWDPANINGTGNNWDNNAIFDWGGKLNPHVRWTP
jgi:arabinogalactan endo-1,4-beta-galactosidase